MACSQSITVEGIERACLEKGINLIGTGDFAHPVWLKELRQSLEPAEQGLFKVKNSNSGVRFILSEEVSTVFERNGRSKRIHNCILLPSFEAVDVLNERLAKHGDLKSDGRPQVSISCAELVEDTFKSESNAFLFPAHAWTPYFGALGNFGFDSMKDAYEDQEKHIHALEMGLSSDSPMNWRISALDKYALLSNSDMHSLPKIGREMNEFEIEESKLSYNAIIGAIKDKDKKIFKRNIEYFAEHGKYHFDGHRQCVVSVDPDKYKITNCPTCGKKLVVGVMHRINDLSDRPPGQMPKSGIPFTYAIPLIDIIGYVLKKNPVSVGVDKIYRQLIQSLGTEFDVLINADIDAIKEKSGNEEIGKAIQNVRENRVNIIPGYAGVFGIIDPLNRNVSRTASDWKQKGLAQF